MSDSHLHPVDYRIEAVSQDADGLRFHLLAVYSPQQRVLLGRYRTREEAHLQEEKLRAQQPIPRDSHGNPLLKKVVLRWSGLHAEGFSFTDAEVEAARRRHSRPDLEWEVRPMAGHPGRYHVVGYRLAKPNPHG